ncbi:MAG: helix-turn-helix domain-containing protein [Solirubrobacteraceae bacterium]
MVNHLRERRHAAGLTQQRLAELAGASRSMVRMLEGGYVPPRRSRVLERVEQVLDSHRAPGTIAGSGPAVGPCGRRP